MIAATIHAPAPLPTWAARLLACPDCHAALAPVGDVFRCTRCGDIGRLQDGIASFAIRADDASVAWYQSVDGTHFHERMQIPYTMSSLETPVYHSYLRAQRPPDLASAIVDLGAGDGRNTEPWLTWGYQRVIAVDAIAASLARLRDRLRAAHPEWLSRVALVQSDLRHVPLATGSVDLALAIEALCYLNEDYSTGLAECRRLLHPAGLLLTSERAWEGALLTHLLYGGVAALCQLSSSRDVWDGPSGHLVRTRAFTEEELLAEFQDAGFQVLEVKSVPVLSMVLGYLRGQGRLAADDQAHLPKVRECLQTLAERGTLRRTHVIVARPQSSST
jgi:SAM-dependent methyltransferase